MNKKALRIIKVLFLFLLVLSGTLNMLWPLDGFRWAYWISRFLLSSSVALFGLSFVIFPKLMMRFYYEDEKDYKEIEHWRLLASSFIAGISFFSFGIWYFIKVWESWIIKCLGSIICNN